MFGSSALSILDDKLWMFIKNKYHMSEKELQIAMLVCRGLNNNEIAGALNIKKSTLKNNLHQIYKRVKVNNKVLLFLKFLEDIFRFYVSPLEVSPVNN
jgi:DNA-binding CsgD family transcriptional regulator